MIENRTGAAGSIAAEAVSRSPADGYTRLLSDTSTWGITAFLPKGWLARWSGSAACRVDGTYHGSAMSPIVQATSIAAWNNEHGHIERIFNRAGQISTCASWTTAAATCAFPSLRPCVTEVRGESKGAHLLREMLLGGKLIEDGGCGFNPKAPRNTLYPAGSNAPGALHFGVNLAQPSDYIRRVLSDWEEPPVHQDLVVLDATVTAEGMGLIDRGFLMALRDPEVVEIAARFGDPLELLEAPV